MKVAPSKVFDLLLGYSQSDDFVYYHLPGQQDLAVNRIFKVLSKAAVKYRLQLNKVATLFIDSSDVLAKFEKDLFIHLLQQAKELANENILKIVFVSSEGSI